MLKLLKPRGAGADPLVISELIADSEQLEAENESLAAKVAALQKENHYLRRANQVQPHVRLVVRAHAAAQLLALWHCAGYRTGRDAAYALGLSIDDWYKARALLMVARLWDASGFVTNDPGTIERQLKVAVERCQARPDLLGYRIPMNRRPKTFRPG